MSIEIIDINDNISPIKLIEPGIFKLARIINNKQNEIVELQR
jgi:hypothetical protein